MPELHFGLNFLDYITKMANFEFRKNWWIQLINGNMEIVYGARETVLRGKWNSQRQENSGFASYDGKKNI